jgi:hypothetical protein
MFSAAVPRVDPRRIMARNVAMHAKDSFLFTGINPSVAQTDVLGHPVGQ